jgi:hypothetical protein
MRRYLLAAAVACALAGCTSLHTVRVQPETVEVGPGLRPLAGLEAHATSLYILFIPIPGVNLDKVVNQMLIVAAKTMGADKIAQLEFHIDSTIGFWCFWGALCQRDAWAKGIAVQVIAPPEDPGAEQGPEPPGAGPGPATPGSPGAPAAPPPAPR